LTYISINFIFLPRYEKEDHLGYNLRVAKNYTLLHQLRERWHNRIRKSNIIVDEKEIIGTDNIIFEI